MIIKKRLRRTLLYLVAFITCIVVLYPAFVMVTTSLKSTAEMYSSNMTILPQEWQWSNLWEVWSVAPLFTYFRNSVIVALGATLLSLICGIPAAYALVRMNFKFKSVYFAAIIISQMFTPVVLLVGIYRTMVDMNLTNNLFGLILVNAAFNQAFTVWLLRGTFQTIPYAMEEAAHVDGCTRFQALYRVLLPQAAPGIVTVLIYVFIEVWNEYSIALTLMTTDALKPISVGISAFSSYTTIEWQYLFAASLYATIPVVILFILVEKHLVAGLTVGGVKE